MARKTSINQAAVNADLRKRFGSTCTRQDLIAYRKDTGIYAQWIRRDPSLRISRGLYRIPGDGEFSGPVVKDAPVRRAAVVVSPTPQVTPAATPDVAVIPTTDATPSDLPTLTAEFLGAADIATKLEALRKQASLLAKVPDRASYFVPFGDFDMVRSVVASRKFFPVFITGLSGNGKTFQIAQACAMEGREHIRVNITAETDRDSLIGGFRLLNGNTVFELGPVLVAAIRGAVLTIDEMDLGGSKMMCLQPVLEGAPIVVPELGITITPAPGFTVFATANTKGLGDADGHFVGTNLMNEAMLDRFPVTVEQEYPSVAVERKILAKTFVAEGFELTDHAKTFFDTLCRWAESIRSTYAEGGIESIIATRRLVHIVKAYGLFGYDDQKALMYCVNRFDPKVKDAFIDLYNKLAPDAAAPSNVGSLD